MGIIEKVKSLKLPASDFVVMGSAVLEVKGIRKAKDIDIIASEQLFDDLKNLKEWEYKTEWGSLGNMEVESLTNNQDVSLYKYIFGGGKIDYFLNDPSTEVIDGIYFASLENLLKVKSSCWDRPKDRRDAELIEEYLNNK